MMRTDKARDGARRVWGKIRKLSSTQIKALQQAVNRLFYRDTAGEKGRWLLVSMELTVGPGRLWDTVEMCFQAENSTKLISRGGSGVGFAIQTIQLYRRYGRAGRMADLLAKLA